MKRWNRPALCAVFVSLVSLTACTAPSSFRTTYGRPAAPAIDTSAGKMAVVYMSGDEVQRRAAEDELVQKLAGYAVRAVASNTLIPAADVGQAAHMQDVFAAQGIQTVLIMRVLDEKETTAVVPTIDRFPLPLLYNMLSQYWGYGWGRVLQPRYLFGSASVSMETLVYSLQSDRLLWAGRSHQVSRADAPTLVAELADAVPKDMRSKGLLAQR